jgi:predicted metalloprotease with PDZ domain
LIRVSAWLAGACLALGSVTPLPSGAARSIQGEPDRELGTGLYALEWVRESPPRFAVEAKLPIDGRELAMATTRPGLIPELDAGGWPALVEGLEVADAEGMPLEVTRAGDGGWRLAAARTGRITLRYEVDFAPLEALEWPAPREAMWVEDGFLSLVGRALFVTTPALGKSAVAFGLPTGWRAVTAWEELAGAPLAYEVPSADALTENLVVLAQSAPDVVSAGGFELLVAPTQPWVAARDEVRRVLEAAIPHLVRFMGSDERASYLVVLLPQQEAGGESYRGSFAMNFDAAPSRANSAQWANTIAHEAFHQWNGWGLKGADYASTQWFQEGFTEYAANVALAAADLVTPEEFLGKLEQHVLNYAQLTTTLEATGGRKGPPLYSAGALVAFTWDVQIRSASAGERSLWDFMRNLWEHTGRGQWPYAWKDIESALDATAKLAWADFHRAHIQGNEPLPLDDVFALAGILTEPRPGGAPLLRLDPAASDAARALWQALVSAE